MKPTLHDLQQLDDDVLRRLPEEALRTLSVTLLADLQGGAGAPTSDSHQQFPATEQSCTLGARGHDGGCVGTRGGRGGPPKSAPGGRRGDGIAGPASAAARRRPGKRPGAPGIGRTERFTAQTTEVRRPSVCAVCGQPLASAAAAVAYTGYRSLDLRWDDPGVHLAATDRQYLEVTCACSHHTRACPGSGAVDPALGKVQVREWRPVGPGLA